MGLFSSSHRRFIRCDSFEDSACHASTIARCLRSASLSSVRSRVAASMSEGARPDFAHVTRSVWIAFFSSPSSKSP